MSVFVLLIVTVAILIPVILYVLIKEEPTSTTITTREDAERSAKTFGGLAGRAHSKSIMTSADNRPDTPHNDDEKEYH